MTRPDPEQSPSGKKSSARFQGLEKLLELFPRLGRNSRFFSKPWKTVGAARPVLVMGLMLLLGGGVAWYFAAHKQPKNTFMGSRECRECHESFYQKWATSFHGLAMQPFTPAFAQAQLTPQTNAIAIGSRQYRYDHATGVVIETTPQGERRFPITVVTGGKNVFYLMAPLERGHLQTLPVAYDVHRRAWFDTAASAVRHFGDRRDEALEWTDRLYTFNTACFACHVSQLATRYNGADDSYATTWLEPGINCETCHGPGAEHVRVCRAAPTNQPPADLRIIITRTMNSTRRDEMCATCHAKLSPLTADYQPGTRFFDHFDMTCLEDADFYPDGRDLGENYTWTGWLLSRCARASKLSCTHCHTSSGRNRFPGAAANQSCLPCHKERVATPAAHTHHAPGTNAPTCVSCHMPKTEFARMRRSDHSLRPPMPAAAKEFGSPLSCLQCHTNHDPGWADVQVREWHADDYQEATLRWARLLQAARRGDWSQSPAMFAYLSSTNREEMVAVALIRLLLHCPDPNKWPVLVQTVSDPSPLVRSAAAAGLEGRFDGDEMAALLRAAGDDTRLVRIRAAQALAACSTTRLSPTDRTTVLYATVELEQSLKLRPDDSVSLYNLGNYHMSRGELNTALDDFDGALRLRPDLVASAVNASLALNQLGRNADAERYLRTALSHAPTNGAVLLNLALLLGEQGRLDEARQTYLQLLKAEPRQATAAYNLAVIIGASDPKAAEGWATRAAEWSPHEWKYAAAQAFYLRQAGDTAGALAALMRFVEQHPTSGSGWLGLATVQAELGQTAAAAETCRRALARTDISDEIRTQLSRLLGTLGAPPQSS
ncbi:MAG: tetratricopeptide repeat protein [Kiritimatiellaeota bacterium]|nr:tetratricopeptide repeat protein [Kiritimatiellota bacterium]